MWRLLGDQHEKIQKGLDQCQQQIKNLNAKIQNKLDTFDKTILKKKARDLADISQLHKLPLKEFSLKYSWSGHFGKIYSLSWEPSIYSFRLLSASKDGHLYIWNTLTTKKELVIPLGSSGVMSCAFSPNGKYVACGGMNNIISLFDIENQIGWEIKKASVELTEHNGYISDIKCITNDFNKILTSSGDHSVKLFDIVKGKSIKTYTNHVDDVECIDVNVNKSLFVSGSIDSMLYVQDYRMDNNDDGDDQKYNDMIGINTINKRKFKGHKSDINTVKWFPDNNAFLSGSDDSTVRLWDIRCMQQLNEYSDKDKLSAASVTTVDCSKSGYYIFAGFDEKPYCIIWNTMTAQMELNDDRQKQMVHQKHVSCLSVSPNGKFIATGSWDKIVRIWE